MTWPSLLDGKGTKGTNRGAYIKTASIRSICTRDTYVNRGTGNGNAFFGGSACVRVLFVRNSCIGRDLCWKY